MRASFGAEVEPDVSNDPPYRSLEIAYNNIIFRLFIWRDMIAEIFEEHDIWGVNFGKPQRSISLEVLGWAGTEWMRDGWITPHNSYIHIIYRAGIIGVALLFVLFRRVISLWRTFLVHRSASGILLMGVLFYWLTIANFLVFLELPHHAIAFWCLIGIIMAYAKDLEASKGNP